MSGNNNKVLISEQILIDIIHAIHQKGGAQALTPAQYAEAIFAIVTGDIPAMELDSGYVEAIYTSATKDLELRNR